MLTADQLRDMRESLATLDGALAAVKEPIDRVVASAASDFGDSVEAFRGMVEMTVTTNLRVIYECAESPIERLFFAALAFGFAAVDPLGGVFRRPAMDAPRWVREYRSEIEWAREWVRQYKRSKYSGDFIDWLHSADIPVRGDAAALDRLTQQWAIGTLGGYRSWQLSMQARFPSVRVDGKSLRVDLFAWIPATDKPGLIVECDGFKYHSTKDAFTRDRRRDRALLAEGYQVLRYSGTEIHGNPLECSLDLYGALRKHRENQ